MRRLLPLLLLLACDPKPTPHTGAVGTPCTGELTCDREMASNPVVAGVVCLADDGEICGEGDPLCEGVCVDLADPSSPCPAGQTRCDVALGSGCVDTSDTWHHCGGCGIVCPEVDGMEPGCFQGECCLWDSITGDCI